MVRLRVEQQRQKQREPLAHRGHPADASPRASPQGEGEEAKEGVRSLKGEPGPSAAGPHPPLAFWVTVFRQKRPVSLLKKKSKTPKQHTHISYRRRLQTSFL